MRLRDETIPSIRDSVVLNFRRHGTGWQPKTWSPWAGLLFRLASAGPCCPKRRGRFDRINLLPDNQTISMGGSGIRIPPPLRLTLAAPPWVVFHSLTFDWSLLNISHTFLNLVHPHSRSPSRTPGYCISERRTPSERIPPFHPLSSRSVSPNRHSFFSTWVEDPHDGSDGECDPGRL